MERPALKQLLADIAAGQVQIIVVYKVDRLTRSLADFAKIVDVLDGHGASFVSVTQQFNTTTSMGRLTLNVLLSFAQFERGAAGPDPTMVRAIARAHEWRVWLEEDAVHSYREIAANADVNPGYVQAVLPLAFLEPRLTRELLDGRRQVSGGLMELLRWGIPIDW